MTSLSANNASSICYPAGTHAYVEFWVPIVISVTAYGIVLIILGLAALAGIQQIKSPKAYNSSLYVLQIKLENLVSLNCLTGKIIYSIKLTLCMISWAIYVTIITRYPLKLYQGSCYNPTAHTLIQVDFAAHMFFLVFLLFRFIAVGDKSHFWFKLSTIIEFCTIPCVILSFFTTRFYHGLIFTRALSFRYFGRILFTWGLLKNPVHKGIVDLVVTFIGIWFAGAGAMHLIENLGNFWESKKVEFDSNWSYFNCVYFLLVTMSTVGYGDISSQSVLGKVFVALFILTALAYFTRTIPEVMKRLQGFDSSTTEKFTAHFGERPVIVCGRFNKWSMKAFLKGFFHSDIELSRRCFKMVLIQSEQYHSSIKATCHKYKTRVQLCRGSPNVPKDLKRINLQDAKEAIIMALPDTTNSDTSDYENIMKAISLKIQSNNLRIILQLQFYRNKHLLSNFALWGKNVEDSVVCMQEIKLGLIAKNAMLPGFSTLIANLLTNYADLKSIKSWREDYVYGISQELYDVGFSPDFHQKSFLDVACIAYELWGVCLVAVKFMSDGVVFINPGPDLFIKPGLMRAIVIALDEREAMRLENYCINCSHTKPLSHCKCVFPQDKFDDPTTSNGQLGKRTIKAFKHVSKDPSSSNRFKLQFDTTGSFYWIDSVSIKEVTYSVEEAHRRIFNNHILILLCIHSEEIEMSLSNLIMPLRSRRIPPNELKDIIILCDVCHLTQEWFVLRNFPRIYIIDGNPTRAKHLQSANIDRAYSVVILSNGESSAHELSDPALVDTDVLIVSVNVQAMLKNAPDVHVLTDLRHSVNAYHFSSKTEHATDIKMSVSLTEPFAQGSIFHDSVLYTFISSVFYNPGVMNFLQTFISGDSAEFVENRLNEGFGVPLHKNERTSKRRCSYACVLSGNEHPIKEIIQEVHSQQKICTYEKVTVTLLKEYAAISLGLYRLKNNEHRYVFTNPPKYTLVDLKDKFYIFRPV